MQRFIKYGVKNSVIFDGTWDEFCQNLVKYDIPCQRKAHAVGLAPNAYDITFDHENQIYILEMDMIEGENLLDHINHKSKTITKEQIDEMLSKVGDLYKRLYQCTKAHHPDWAARNIMIQTKDNQEKYFVIDFEAFYVDETKIDQELSDEDFEIAMGYFSSDLSCSFKGEMKKYLLDKYSTLF